MQFYKKGDGSNASLIQKAFEAKGYTTNSGVGLDPNMIYFTVRGYKTVQRCSITSITVTLLDDLKELYQELCLPKFKVGDVLQDTRLSKSSFAEVCDIDFKKEEYVILENTGAEISIPFAWAHKFCDYYDEKEIKLPFEAGDLVLVRDTDYNNWKVDIFSHMSLYEKDRFTCTSGLYKQCIPFKENKHLAGTSQKCCKQYPPICYGKT